MPTAAKLFAAIAFALVGFFAAEVMKPSFPEGFNFGNFSIICALVGVIAGWRVMGSNAGQGTGRAMGTGVRTSATLAFWGLVLFGAVEMLKRSTDSRYNGVMDALEGLFAILLEFGQIVMTSLPALIVLVVGGILGGMFSNWAAARWN